MDACSLFVRVDRRSAFGTRSRISYSLRCCADTPCVSMLPRPVASDICAKLHMHPKTAFQFFSLSLRDTLTRCSRMIKIASPDITISSLCFFLYQRKRDRQTLLYGDVY